MSSEGVWPKNRPLLSVFLSVFMMIPHLAVADDIALTYGLQDGFYIKTSGEGGPELHLGGSFQADYRTYNETARADDRFDIRKARLSLRGRIVSWLGFGLEYEFQPEDTNNLVDAYLDWQLPASIGLKAGQFKEPYGLDWSSPDKALLFAERSMGNCLSPQRDVGLMLHGSALQETFSFGMGLFNGNGEDGSNRGSEHDEPEIAGRLAIKPFAVTGIEGLESFQLGASGARARIDPALINIKVKSTGMTGLSLNVYTLTPNTKFGLIDDVGRCERWGAEAGWSWGPVAAWGEYFALVYTELHPVTGPISDAKFSDWYVSLAWCPTGEAISFAGGVLNPILPRRPFDPAAGGYGAVCLALRSDHFHGDEDLIKFDDQVSVRKADALSVALTWILIPQHRIMLDFTRTILSDPLRVRVNPDGSADHIDRENVATARFSLDL